MNSDSWYVKVKIFIRHVAKTSVLGIFYAIAGRNSNGIRLILLYHSINDQKAFLQQMAFAKKHFRFALLKNLKIELQTSPKDENILFCTFDDGDATNYSTALPVLQKLGLKATFFIVAGLLGGHLEERPMMTVEQVKELHKLGHEIGAHTMTHPRLTEIPNGRAAEEMWQSKKVLENITGGLIVSFAYPYGAYNNQIRDIAKTIGFDYSATINEGLLQGGALDWWQLPRVEVNETLGAIQFKAKLSGALEAYEALRGRRKNNP